MLCALCTKIFSGPAPLYNTKYQFHATGAQFKQAVDSRCHPCHLLWHQFTLHQQTVLSEHSEPIQYEFKTTKDFLVHARRDAITFSLSGIPFANSSSAAKGPRLILYENRSFAEIKVLENTTASESSFLFAKKQLENCFRYHKNCKVDKDSRWTPSRLICIDPWPLRLCEGSEIGYGVEYITLSHRWINNPVKLLAGIGNHVRNVEDFKKAIPFEELSKTFQDAITFTQRLDVRFIWIDSLCIAQDSLEDWAQESSRMGDVYRNSKCNLAASAAARGTDGLFVDRDSLLFMPCSLENKWKYPQNASSRDQNVKYVTLGYEALLGRVETEDYSLITDHHLEDRRLSNFPLQKRGWMFQERFLSPRKIHFDYQIHWECDREGNSSEMWPLHDTAMYRRDDGTIKNRKYRPEVWKKLVEVYSGCTFTKRTDRLIALSGIAKEMERNHGMQLGKYLAGLWRNNLVYQLLWRVSDKKGANRPKDSCAPSWSWASVDGAVSFPNLSSRITFNALKVIHAEMITHYNGKWVQVSGKIKVQGYLRAIKLSDVQRIRLQRFEGITRENWKVKSASVIFDEEETSDTDFYSLPVKVHTFWWIYCLLLRRNNISNDQFSRVGYWSYEVATENKNQEWNRFFIGEVPHGEGLLMVGDTEPSKFEITLV